MKQTTPRFFILFAMILTISAPVYAQTSCETKLSEIDQRLASTGLDASLKGAVKQMRDHGASMCAQGNSATAVQTLGMVEMMLPPTQETVDAVNQANKQTIEALTNEFLQGTWCSMKGEERSQLVFAVDGSVKTCFHDAVQGPYGRCHAFGTRSDWLDRWERAATVRQDLIVLEGKRGNRAEFRRGACAQHGR